MSANDILHMMRQGLVQVPAATEKSVPVAPALTQEHAGSKGSAMQAESPALDEDTRMLIYLAAALAGTSTACVKAIANKIAQQGIAANKVIETVHIVRLAKATKVIGDAEPVFGALARKTN